MKVQDVPNEVLIQILERVPRTTVYQCLYVCKAWKRAALEEFYQQVSFNGKMITQLKKIIRPKKRATLRIVTYGELVKNLGYY